MMKRKKRNAGEDKCKLENRISELPDEVLVNIVSLLPLKEAVASSTLSHRRRNVWTETKNLNFEAFHIFDTLHKIEHIERLEYVWWVDCILQKHRQKLIISRFVLICKLDIEDWVIFATKNKVQKFELDFLTFCNAESPNDVSTFYTFPLEDLE